MGIVKHEHLTENISYLVWAIEESEEELLAFLENTNCNFEHIKNQKVRLESIAARVALQHLLEDSPVDFKGIKKEESGKPSLINDEYGISLSHSKGFAAAIIDRSQKNIGIDIENIQPKVLRLIPRFANDEELAFAQNHEEDPANATQIWTIKEAIYKAFGKLNIEFKSQIKTVFENSIPKTAMIKVQKGDFVEYKLQLEELETIKIAIAYL
ncbi:4'-phosphopantetheinyl transferase superfamily protein [Flammeovirga sp. EKP202]|uniref:4'-phosphopantetheinyl transferase family protein n=1 Tax=Flammeovirga sp. EKP202 TaxID=2770592 RepID=UPI00165F3D55|nr:4'-phosphopantetheinyl transferase superfamily protein [Flammeovirga sp. EKP202]MBD0404444.1 4'-phosphopantetheinyl transferase superfamily protein [Flammeovirga sp. EKP202]